MKETQEVNAYGFAEFCKETEKLIQAGYKFDFESNAGFPTAFGTFFNAILVKSDSTEQDVANDLRTSLAFALQEVDQLKEEVLVVVPEVKPTELVAYPQDEAPVVQDNTPAPKAGRPKKS